MKIFMDARNKRNHRRRASSFSKIVVYNKNELGRRFLDCGMHLNPLKV